MLHYLAVALLLRREQDLDMSAELWGDDPELQRRFNEVQETVRRLQIEFGITPRTIEQRHQDYLSRKAEEARRAEELKKLNSQVGLRRPPPKWRV